MFRVRECPRAHAQSGPISVWCYVHTTVLIARSNAMSFSKPTLPWKTVTWAVETKYVSNDKFNYATKCSTSKQLTVSEIASKAHFMSMLEDQRH